MMKRPLPTINLNIIYSIKRMFHYSIFFALVLIAAGNTYSQTVVPITATGSWTVPTGVTSATIYLWGGGGGAGGSTTGTWFANGGGGGGGACASATITTLVPGNSYTITIGAGGTAGSTSGGNGGTGGTTTFTGAAGTWTAGGGSGGAGSTGGGGVHAGGAGSAAFAGTGATVRSGGTGSAGNDGTSATTGITGTGGGGGGSTAAGTSPASICGVLGTGGTGTYPGGNGSKNADCNTTTNLAGTAGVQPGGGGAGANCWTGAYKGGAGGAGEVIIVYNAPTPTITSFTPTSGCSAGLPLVTITGTNFTGATTVKFNGTVAASFTVVNNTSITATPAAGTATGLITVITGGGTATSSSSFTIFTTPTAVTVSGGGVTCTGSATLTASGGTGGIIYFQGTTSGGTSTATASSSQTVTTSGTYYFNSYNGGCWGTQGSATVTINTVPATPTSVTASPTSVCSGQNSVLNATSAGNNINWWTAATGGTELTTVASGANYTVAPTATTTYYAESQSSGGTTTQTFNYTGAITTFTVPAGVTSLNITALGASGGYASGSVAGNGASMSGTFAVTSGQVLSILVGQSPGLTSTGGYTYPAGGGGTFVGLGASYTTATPLIVAGGGGGAYGGSTGTNAPTTTSGTGTTPGTAGNGAPIGGCGGGGGGFYTSGGADMLSGFTGGSGFNEGGAGGTALGNAAYQIGGFGGGAAANYIGVCNQEAGAGGGYSGGSSVAESSATSGVGTAGGSYNGGTSQTNVAGSNAGNGQVTITYTIPTCASTTRVPVTVTVSGTPPSATTVSGGGTACGSATLTASGGTGGIIYFQGTTSGGTSTATASSSQTVTTSGTYYFNSYNGGCWGTQGSATVTINTVPATPTSVTASPTSVCSGQNSVLNATSAGNNINWWTAATGGTELTTIASGANYTVAPTATTTYYAESQSSGGTTTQTFNYTGAITTFTVPAGVTSLNITALGASGGYASGSVAGNGASMSGTFAVTSGQVLSILVGQSPGLTSTGGYTYPAGGGGTFVGLGASYTTATPLIVAGGGGGAYGGSTGTNAPTTTSGTGTTPGTAGNGAPIGGCGGGGGGFYTSGGADMLSGFTGGSGFNEGGAGGTALGNAAYQIGGFGGGAAANYIGVCNQEAGAGGGYSGGSSVAESSATSGVGTAGGSYNGGTSQTNVAGSNAGNGQVTITYTIPTCASTTRVPVTVTVSGTPPSATTVSGGGTACGSATLTASGGTGGIIYFQGTTSGGTSTATPSSSQTVTTSGTYYFNSYNGGCWGTQGSATVTINTVPATPTSVTASPTSVCSGQNSILNATSAGNNINWWTAATGGTELTTVASGANYTVAPTATTTYYAESQSAGGTTTQTFSYTGAQQTWTVPAGVTSITVDVRGAAGGSGGNATLYNPGGNGGRVQGTYAVTSGQTLYINVGGAGGNETSTAGGTAGFNGGGTGGNDVGAFLGGGGGGASDIRNGGTALSNRIFVAGGGGGGGDNTNTANQENGGPGGASTAILGAGYYTGTQDGSTVYCGQGGTTSAGVGATGCVGTAAALGSGGSACATTSGGGGGGGYYGGGCGEYAGAGGGSNYNDPSATSVTNTTGYQTGNGQVLITYVVPTCSSTTRVAVTVTVLSTPTPTIVSAGGGGCGGSATLTASGGTGGTIYFQGTTNGGTSTATPSTSRTVTTSGTYYFNSYNGTCWGAQGSATVTITPIPAAPTATATPPIVCGGASSALVGTSTGNSINWWTSATGGTLLTTVASGTSYNVAPSSTTTYYAEATTASSGIATFSYTGAQQTWTVPSGVTSITVDVQGAAGGGNGDGALTDVGGNGGRIQGTIAVTPGQTLFVNVGGMGAAGNYGTATTGAGGFNGGGNGYEGGGGGGASDIRTGGTALSNIIFVAGGGGGAGYNYPDNNYDDGGPGGGLIGGAGYSGNVQDGNGYPGSGGTQSAGGAAGTYSGFCTATPGTLGAGGSDCSSSTNSGGGGGGGYYGGGGGVWSGGGGGSNWSSLSATSVTNTQGYQTGNGQVIITYTPQSGCVSTTRTPVTVTVSTAPSVSITPASPYVCGTVGVQITASPPGASSYAWSPTTGLSSSTIANPTATPTVATTYTVTVTGTNGCTASANSIVNIAPAVTATATATPSVICSGSNSQLQATGSETTSAGYTVSSITYSPVTSGSGITTLISNGTAITAVTAGTLDDGYWSGITIPFNFNFYGTNYTSMSVSTNGVLEFGTPFTAYVPTAVPQTTQTDYIAGVWSDLITQTAGANITTYTSGTAPNRVFVTYYNNVPFYSGGATTPTGNTNFTMELYETTNIIEVHVGQVTGAASTTTLKELAVDNAAGTSGVAATGDNATAWTVATTSPVAWRFTPISPTFNYAWSPATYLNQTNISNPLGSNMIATTTYTVTVSDPTTGCHGTATDVVTVNPNAAITLTSAVGTNTQYICQTVPITNITYSVTGGGTGAGVTGLPPGVTGTYSSGVFTISGIPTTLASGAYPYIVTTTGTCAQTTATGTITVNPNPTSAAISDVIEGCNGGHTATVNVTGGTSPYTFSLSCGGTYTAAVPYSLNAGGASSCNLTSVADAHGCVPVTITGNPVTYPARTLTAGNTQTCAIGASTSQIFFDGSGNLMTQVTSGTTALGSTTVVTTIDPTVQEFGPTDQQHYLQRHFQITPTTSAPANVCLYLSNTEIAALNTASATDDHAAPSYYQTFATNLSNANISQYDGGSETPSSHTSRSVITSYTATQNPTVNGAIYNNAWQICFNVGGFSGFYVHSANTNNNALPVTLINFTATAVNNEYIQLNWSTALEINNAGFQIERSTDGVNFAALGWVDGHGNSTIVNNYKYGDMAVQPDQVYYYRLKQEDVDGNFVYTNIVSASLQGGNNFNVETLFPNPASTSVSVGVISNVNVSAVIKMTDILGRKVLEEKWPLSIGYNTNMFDISQYAAGTYTVTLYTDDANSTKKLVITK